MMKNILKTLLLITPFWVNAVDYIGPQGERLYSPSSYTRKGCNDRQEVRTFMPEIKKQKIQKQETTESCNSQGAIELCNKQGAIELCNSQETTESSNSQETIELYDDEFGNLGLAHQYDEFFISLNRKEYKEKAEYLIRMVWCGSQENLAYLWEIIDDYQKENAPHCPSILSRREVISECSGDDKTYLKNLYPLIVKIFKYNYEKFCKENGIQPEYAQDKKI